MKLAYQQLEQHLTKKLAGIYVLSGDELLLIQDAANFICNAAHKAGFTERTIIAAEANTDWGKILYSNVHNLSLLATKRIVKLNIVSTKLTAECSQILQDFAAKPPADTLLLVCMNKVDSKIEKTAWYQALEKNGIVIQIWPITAEQLPAWIKQRAQKSGLNITTEASALLANQVEGNLLAAAQEIEKLCLLSTTETIDNSAVEKLIADNARFDIFQLVDSALLGNSSRCLRILDNLKADDTEPPLVLWALARELRTLAEIAKQTKQGATLSSLFSKFRIWEKRQPSVRSFLQRHTRENCWQLLSQAAQIDRLIKGAEAGNTWDTLQRFAMNIAGKSL